MKNENKQQINNKPLDLEDQDVLDWLVERETEGKDDAKGKELANSYFRSIMETRQRVKETVSMFLGMCGRIPKELKEDFQYWRYWVPSGFGSSGEERFYNLRTERYIYINFESPFQL